MVGSDRQREGKGMSKKYIGRAWGRRGKRRGWFILKWLGPRGVCSRMLRDQRDLMYGE